jgi:hypothetical protein
MAVPRPTVRSLIVCETILPDRDHPTRVSLVHLIDRIHPAVGSTYPLLHPQLSVFAQLTECRGTAEYQIRVHQADTDQPLFGSSVRRLTLPHDPLALHGLRFRLLRCRFLRPGLYWVQLWIDNEMAAQTPLLLQ